jgi:hypothetical protein
VIAKLFAEVAILNPRSQAFGYVILCAASVVLVSIQADSPMPAKALNLAILTAGILGLVVPVQLAPLLVVGLLVVNETLWKIASGPSPQNDAGPELRFNDFLQAIGALGYVAGHYRLQSLSQLILQPDRGDLTAGPAPAARRRRPVEFVTTGEIILLAATLPLWAVAGLAAWEWLAQPRDVLHWDVHFARLAVALLILVPGFTAAAFVLQHWRRRLATAAEAHLFLQDVFWKATRGQQRLVARWLAWFWLGRKEKP